MKVDLIESDEIVIELDGAEFVFKEIDSRTWAYWYQLQTGKEYRKDPEAATRYLLSKLKEIRGIATESGDKVSPKDFLRLPNKIINHVITGMVTEIIKLSGIDLNQGAEKGKDQEPSSLNS